MKIALLKTLRENVEELLSIISSAKRFLKLHVSVDSYLTLGKFKRGLFLEVSDIGFLR